MSLFSKGGGKQTRALRAYLRRRARAAPARRPELDCRAFPKLFTHRAVVFTDTADFTVRTARDGILHFLMLFEQLLPLAERAVKRHAGRIVKVEGDSLLLLYPEVTSACRGVREIDKTLAGFNRGRPENERLRFSYGIGAGDILELEGDLFGLEVNLASKAGEDLARPDEALLTPAAAAALPPGLRKRVVPYRTVAFGGADYEVKRLEL